MPNIIAEEEVACQDQVKAPLPGVHFLNKEALDDFNFPTLNSNVIC